MSGARSASSTISRSKRSEKKIRRFAKAILQEILMDN
jgi:hypothetical protein